MKKPIGLVDATYASKSPNFNAARCINFYPHTEGGQKALFATPGIQELYDQGEVRGMLEHKGVGYAVCGNKLYSFTASTAPVSLGTLITSSGVVSMAVSTVELCVVDGANGYILTLADSSFAQITDLDFPGASQVVFADGYYVSGLYDGATWDAIDFASAEGVPDDVVGLTWMNDELIIFGQKSVEFYYNDGGQGFPFSPIKGARQDARGCSARFSIAKDDNTVAWLGNDGIVYRLNGRQPERISTSSIEYLLHQHKDEWESAISFTYTDGGHKFYVLRLPSVCVCADASNGAWHERSSKGVAYGETWKPQHYIYLNNKHIVGGDKIYEMSRDVYDDDGTEIQRIKVSRKIESGLTRVRHNILEIDGERGVGLDTGQGEDPTVMLDWSDDGGHTWSSERTVSFGKIGEYSHRARFTRLGSSRERYYRIKVTDPVNWVLLEGHLQAEPFSH